MKRTALFILALLTHAGASHAAVKIQSLDWLSGQWVGEFHGAPMEAQYSSSSGGVILGMTKIASGERLDFFEFEKVYEDQGNLVLQPFPFGQPGVTFALKSITANKAVFENPAHDFPTRIIYELGADGSLLARIEGTQNGQPVSEDFLFTKTSAQ